MSPLMVVSVRKVAASAIRDWDAAVMARGADTAIRASLFIFRSSVQALGAGRSTQLAGRGHHLVGRADNLRVHLVSALRCDQVGDLGHDVDVAGFKRALDEPAIAGSRRVAG